MATSGEDSDDKLQLWEMRKFLKSLETYEG